MLRAPALSVILAAGVWSVSQSQSANVPRIWDDKALADWATPVAGLNVRPAHYSSAEYYRLPADNFRTYPVYHPGSEPPGYWAELQTKTPEPLVDVGRIRSETDWIAAGERAFREADNYWSRTDDPAFIAAARDPKSFEGVLKLPDGTASGVRWVVTRDGLRLSSAACSNCHFTLHPDRTVSFAGPGGPRPPDAPAMLPRGLGALGVGAPRALQLFFSGEAMHVVGWRMFTVPWAPDARVERVKTQGGAGAFARTDEGVFHRTHGSPFYATKIPDLHTLRYVRYMDATATHRLRGPEDIGRYMALVTGADPMDFGPHRILTDDQRQLRFRYADELLYAVGKYLMALEPRKNPSVAAPELVARGQTLFTREGCIECHAPPNYTTGRLTLAHGWQPPQDHPSAADIDLRSVGTDPGLALKTRKGTGLYKIPSLRGVWYRPRLLHDGSLTSLEEMFDPARLNPDYQPRGWSPPDARQRPVVGHQFGLRLNQEEKAALLAFLRSL